jgi:hypothetical protein
MLSPVCIIAKAGLDLVKMGVTTRASPWLRLINAGNQQVAPPARSFVHEPRAATGAMRI